MDIFKLVGSVFVDTDSANKSLAKVGESSEAASTKLGSIAKTAGTVALGVAGAATAVGTAMVAAAKETASNADTIDKASQRMKISSDSYQELAHAAGLCGVDMSTLEQAAKKLEGTDLNLDDALNEIYALGTEEERSAKAAELFGDKVAYNMTPMLNASAEDMASMRQEAHDLGAVMDEDAVKAGATMNDTFSKVSEAMTGITNQIGAEVMPIVAEVLQWVLDHMPEIQAAISTAIEVVRGAIEALMPIIKKVLEIATPVIKGIISYMETLAPIVLKVVTTILNGIQSALRTIVKVVNTVIRGLNKIKIPSWVPGIGGKGINIAELPALAKGGTIEDGQAIVGEAGPELVTVNNGKATVKPLTSAEKAQAVNNNNSVTINVYATEKQDVRQLATLIMDEIQSAVDRKGAVFA